MGGCKVDEREGAFQVTVTLEEAMLCRALHTLRSPKQAKAMLAVAVLGVVGVLCLFGVIPFVPPTFALIFIVYTVIFPFQLRRGEKKNAHAIMERAKASQPPDLVRVYTFGNEFVSYSPKSGTRLAYEYAAVKTFQSGREFFLLVVDKGMLVALPKSGFASGQAERFEAFLGQKLKALLTEKQKNKK